MDDVRETRSVGLATAVVATLGIGLILGYALIWVSADADAIKLARVGSVLDLYGDGWILDLARAGVLLALIAALAFPRSQQMPRAVCISAGALTALALPLAVLAKLAPLDSPGAGLILFALAAGITAIIPWLAPYCFANPVTMEPVGSHPQR